MENQEIDLDTVIYGYINTINANYARMNANFKIPNILITWNHKSN